MIETAIYETKSGPTPPVLEADRLVEVSAELNLLLRQATCSLKHYLERGRASRLPDKAAYDAYIGQSDILAGKIQEVVDSGLTVTLRGGMYAGSPYRIRRTSGECFNVSLLEASQDRSGTAYFMSERVAMLAAATITVEEEAVGTDL